MFTLIAENLYGEQIELTNNDAYVITDIDGLDPPDATINTIRNANSDGSVFNSSYIEERQIIITMSVNYPAEENRINLYKYFKTKKQVKIYYQNETRDVFITGYVKSIQIGLFNKKQTAQITVICPQPLFKGATDTVQEFSVIEKLFEFPFSSEISENGFEFSTINLNVEQSIINAGDVEYGAQITIHALGPVANPKIYNLNTGEHIFINASMTAGQDIVINTRKGEKSIVLINEGVSQNIIADFDKTSSWLQLSVGDNMFTLSADDGVDNMQVTFDLVNLYEGV